MLLGHLLRFQDAWNAFGTLATLLGQMQKFVYALDNFRTPYQAFGTPETLLGRLRRIWDTCYAFVAPATLFVHLSNNWDPMSSLWDT